MATVGANPATAADDPERLLDEWLGELVVLSAGLDVPNDVPRIDSYRFSMANLEETQDTDLDAILGELCALQNQCDIELSGKLRHKRSRSENEKIFQPTIAKQTLTSPQSSQTITQQRERTDSPDNDSAFSDTLSLLSSESSASSEIGTKLGNCLPRPAPAHLSLPSSESSASNKNSSKMGNGHSRVADQATQEKIEKIKLAFQKIQDGTSNKLFVKAYSLDGSAKSLLVDEEMTCGYVTRLLADKNHFNMEPKWAIVERFPELFMEHLLEDHENFVDNLLYWPLIFNNKIIFCERPDKISLFQTPEKFLLLDKETAPTVEYDEQSRLNLLEEFFKDNANTSHPKNSSLNSFSKVPIVEGPLYLKSDVKKGWKKYIFMLRPSGLYYFSKEKVRNLNDLVCLSLFETNEVYTGFGWRKKFKAPTEYGFALKSPRVQELKNMKLIKFLCADDQATMERWITGIRIAKHGRRLFENYKTLVEELAQEDLDHLAHARSALDVSIASTPSISNGVSFSTASGRSSVSSGCLSDSSTTASENGFVCDFPMGTIKRKPTMKPNIPLTSLSRQLRDVAGATNITEDCIKPTRSDAVYTNTGTLTRVHSRTRSSQSTEINISGCSSPSSRSLTPVGSMPRTLSHHSGNTINSSGKDLTAFDFIRNSSNDIHVSNDKIPDILRKQYCDINNTLDKKEANMYKVFDHKNNVKTVCNDNIVELPYVVTNVTIHKMFSSSESLESLPLPPPPSVFDCILPEDSLLSLPPPPPPFTELDIEAIVGSTTIPLPPIYASSTKVEEHCKLPSLDLPDGTVRYNKTSPKYEQSKESFASCIAELQRQSSECDDNFAIAPTLSNGKPVIDELLRKSKRATVTFFDDKNIANSPPPLFAKPLPPKRNDNTRLTFPKKLSDSPSNPTVDFWKDLQRVMRKKWQVAQKCSNEPAITPHEVLGFREYPLSENYKEASVSNWVEEHCSIMNQPDNLYENLQMDNIDSACRNQTEMTVIPFKKRPPPPPPKRSNTTQLTYPQM